MRVIIATLITIALATLILPTPTSKEEEVVQWNTLAPWLECDILISRGSVETDPSGLALLEEEGVRVCPYGEKRHGLLKAIATLSNKEIILLIGHGGVEGGEDTFDGGSYLSYAGLGKQVGILSCRGLPDEEPLYSREILPHREMGVWVWGKRGYKIGAQFHKQWHAFKRQAEVWRALAPVRK